MKYSTLSIALWVVLMGAGCDSPADLSSDNKLNLSYHDLTLVSQDIFARTNLVELDLSGNHLTGTIPAEIRFLKSLRILDLSNNALTGLPAELGQLMYLTELDASHNQISGLPLELGQLSRLRLLDLRGNPVSMQDLKVLREKLPHTQILFDGQESTSKSQN